MGDTNYFSGIVKILENPVQKINKNDTIVTKIRVELPQIRKSRIVCLVFWGNLANTVKDYYQINDYILVEGYLSVQNQKKFDFETRNYRPTTITILKVSPLLLQSNRNITGT